MVNRNNEGCRLQYHPTGPRLPSQLVLTVLVGCIVLSGCAASVHPTTAPSGTPFPQFKVLTFNALHGLEPSGLMVKAGESPEVHQGRLNLQFQQLSVVQPDVILLQEVNPLPDMAKAYVTALKGFGLTYQEVHQVDACGLRLAPGVAVVRELNNGLAVLAKAPLLLRKIEGVKLSGGFGGCVDFMGLQTGELRYALIAEVENPGTGRSLLAVSLHLHSGIERTAFFVRKINEAVEEGRARQEDFEDIVAEMEQDQKRRLGEIRVLVEEIRKRYAQGSYLGVIVGGDFNFEPDDPEYRELERAGLQDTYTIAHPESKVYSLDPEHNAIARQAVREVPSALREAIKRLPESQQEKILSGYQRGISQARRVDYLFLMTPSSNGPKGCLRQELFGRPSTISTQPGSDQPGSDHFGVLDTYIADPSQCSR
jgi:endonuclease/exonuclease/phosphatase family metal-dependent hydrolase